MKKCLHCNNELANQKNKFCNTSCAASYNNTRKEKKTSNCSWCDSIIKRGSKYCNNNNKCLNEHKHDKRFKEYIQGNHNGLGKNFFKQMVINRDGYKCNCCALSDWMGKKIVLELEHIDGNSENNTSENLILLCPNCHSQTPTFKNRNMGNGRAYRRQRYAEGKSY